MHSVGARRVGGVVVDGFGCGWRRVVVVALDAAQTVIVVHHQSIEQGVVHAIEFDGLVTQKYADKLAILHHRTKVA